LERNVVGVRASSSYSSYVAKNVADLATDSYWHSENQDNSWLCYNLKNMRVKPTHYSIRSRYNGGENTENLRNWIVEVSNNGEVWRTIDERWNNGDLNGMNLVHAFKVEAGDWCRYIRIRHQGMSWYGNCYVSVSSFELFGEIKE
jgi:hypothetical protein